VGASSLIVDPSLKLRLVVGEPNPTVDRVAETEFHDRVVQHATALDWDAPRVKSKVAPEISRVSVKVDEVDGVCLDFAGAVGGIHIRVDGIGPFEERFESVGIGCDRFDDALGGVSDLVGVEPDRPECLLCSWIEMHGCGFGPGAFESSLFEPDLASRKA